MTAATRGRRGAWLLDAYTGHAGSVTALLCDSVAAKLDHEMAELVPTRYLVLSRDEFRKRDDGGTLVSA